MSNESFLIFCVLVLEPNSALLDVFTLDAESEPWLVLKIAEPAGFILTADISPPSAPKAPLIDLNRAVPNVVPVEYLTASEIFCPYELNILIRPNIIKISFFIL